MLYMDIYCEYGLFIWISLMTINNLKYIISVKKNMTSFTGHQDILNCIEY